MELGRKNLETPEQLDSVKTSENEPVKNLEQDKKRADSLDKSRTLENTSERDVRENRESPEQNQTLEERRSEKLEQKPKLHEKISEDQTNKRQENSEEGLSSKKNLEDMSWNDIHKMQEKNPEKLAAINKDYQERISAEGFGMSVEEYRAHLDRIEEANAPEESQEETKTEDWRQKMEEDLLQNSNMDIKEEQLEGKKDSVQEQYEKLEKDSFRGNDSNEVQDKPSHPAKTANEVSEQKEVIKQSDLYENSVENKAQILSNKDVEYQEGKYEDAESNHGIYDSESESRYGEYQKVEQDNEKQESSSNITAENNIKEVPGYSSEIQERIEKYSSKTFRKEDSFDVTVYNKNEVCENNHMLSEEDGEKMLSKEQIQEIKDLRESVPHPTEDTVMQKVVSEEQIQRYIEPNEVELKQYGGIIGGYISKAEDTAPFTKTPKEAYENCRLDYPNNKL